MTTPPPRVTRTGKLRQAPRTVSIDDKTVEKLKAVGGGSLSEGIRKAAEVAYQKYQREP